MELVARATIARAWPDSIDSREGIRADVASMHTRDGHGRVQPPKSPTPPTAKPEPKDAPTNAPRTRRIMFAIDVLDGVVALSHRHDAYLVGQRMQYEDLGRLFSPRVPAGIITWLAEKIA